MDDYNYIVRVYLTSGRDIRFWFSHEKSSRN